MMSDKGEHARLHSEGRNIMAKQDGATGAKGPKFKTLSDTLVAFDNDGLPRGTKVVVTPNVTRVVRQTKNTQEIFFEFEGTPAQLLKHVLGKIVKTKLKVELDPEAESKQPPSDKSDG
jgi:hypothetical protein